MKLEKLKNFMASWGLTLINTVVSFFKNPKSFLRNTVIGFVVFLALIIALFAWLFSWLRKKISPPKLATA